MKRIGWVANVLLVAGTVLVGEKSPTAFLLIALGESLWCVKVWRMKQWDMLFICVVFSLLAVRNYLLWTR